ncbi:MAG: tRNA-dihydrouridine synthase [Bacteroidales bacterium]|nr:tRNA-dihydrouridine synthase [Bacteroidales bacterium]
MKGSDENRKTIYLEAGSGAAKTVGLDMIRAIRKKISLPLIVGGGITSIEKAREVYQAGADMIVVSTVLEKQPELIRDFCALREQLNR